MALLELVSLGLFTALKPYTEPFRDDMENINTSAMDGLVEQLVQARLDIAVNERVAAWSAAMDAEKAQRNASLDKKRAQFEQEKAMWEEKRLGMRYVIWARRVYMLSVANMAMT